MAQLTADKARVFEEGLIQEIGVKASTTIYRGSAVGIDSATGYARQLAAGDQFVGFALEKADNASGANDAIKVKVQAYGMIELSVASAAVTDIGKSVFASDGDTFVLTQSTNSHIGTICRFVSTGKAIVKFDGGSPNGSFVGIAELTDSSGGTASDTIADVPAAYNEATLANQIASLAAKINALIRRHR
jgi:hypothetical protein